ncbi:apicoplast pyruvate carrier 1-like [Tachypleus tridentatus]|uniref:apicoplast pyruvate carrier 1-like n=1 Tax=Tachypleus tridentatus TaxID=6853 RepID=UPI003FD21EBB
MKTFFYVSFGILGTYWSIQHSLVTTIITYGVIDTLGFVCCFGHPLVTAVELFPNKKGFVTGLVASGFAVTPLFMNSVQTFLVNPNNLQPASDGYFYNDEIIESVPALFLIMASITGGILLIGLLMYEELPQELKQEETVSTELTCMRKTSRHSCIKESSTNTLDSRTTINIEKLSTSLDETPANSIADDEQPYRNKVPELRVTPAEALKMKEFYLLSIVCMCSYYPFTFVSVFYKTYGQTFIGDDTFLSIVGSVAGAVHALSRVTVGLIQDKISYKLTTLFLLGIKTVLLFTMVATSLEGKVMYMICICGLSFTFSLAFVCIPAAVAEVFGSKYTAEILGMVYFTSTASFFLWALFIHRIISSLGWFATFCVTATVSFTGILVTILFPETQQTQPVIPRTFDKNIEGISYVTFEH